jgi:hypothetical protein
MRPSATAIAPCCAGRISHARQCVGQLAGEFHLRLGEGAHPVGGSLPGRFLILDQATQQLALCLRSGLASWLGHVDDALVDIADLPDHPIGLRRRVVALFAHRDSLFRDSR